jgi:transcription elongation GreA/GreB family factor
MSPVIDTVDKAEVLEALRQRVAADLEALERSQRDTQEAATHEEARPENDKDTRALEQSYLARGLAQRVAELASAASKLARMRLRPFSNDQPLAIGALVELEDEHGERFLYFVAPAGGGTKISVSGRDVRVLTPESPFGRAALGKKVDEDIEVRIRGTRQVLVVAALA